MRFTISEPIYESELHVWVGEDFRTMFDCAAKKYGISDDFKYDNLPDKHTQAQITHHSNMYRTAYLWVRLHDVRDPYFIGVIAHEMAHFAFMTFETINNAFIHTNEDEPFCYLLKFYVEQYFANMSTMP